MLNKKLNYKLVNCALIMVIIFLIYKTGNLWFGIINKIGNLILPFALAFAIAYVLYPLLRFLENKKLSKGLALTVVISIIIGLIVVVCILVGPSLFNQLRNLFNSIITFLKNISSDNSVNLDSVEATLSNVFNNIISNLGKVVSDGLFNVIGSSINILSTLFISFASSIYFLADMENMRRRVSKLLNKKKTRRFYKYLKTLDEEMMKYLSGFIKIMLISFVEYSIVFTIIGHPDALLLAFTAMLAPLIPYFGGIINNLIAIIVASTVSPALLIRTIIASFLLTTFDGNVTSPIVYGKTNQIKPILVIMSVFIFGALFGIPGIVISMPATIFIVTTFRYFEDDLKEKLEDIREDLIK